MKTNKAHKAGDNSQLRPGVDPGRPKSYKAGRSLEQRLKAAGDVNRANNPELWRRLETAKSFNDSIRALFNLE